MPTKKPRVMLTVPDDLNDLLEELSDLQGMVKTKLIIDLLIQIKPILEANRDALKAVKEGISPQDALLALIGSAFSDLGDFGEELKQVSKKNAND